MNNKYFQINTKCDFHFRNGKFFIKDYNNSTELLLHGKLTDDIFLPIYDELNSPLKLEYIAKKTNHGIKEVYEYLHKLYIKNILIEYSDDYFFNTNNHNLYFDNKLDRWNILIISNNYFSQIDELINKFKQNAKIHFYFILNNDSETILKKIKDRYHHNFLLLDNLQELNEVNIDMAISFFYGNFTNIKLYNKNIQNLALYRKIPLIFINFCNNFFLMGPFYFPNKTSGFTDVDIEQFNGYFENEIFYINPFILSIIEGTLINEISWYIMNNIRPVTLNRIFIGNTNEPFFNTYKIYRS